MTARILHAVVSSSQPDYYNANPELQPTTLSQQQSPRRNSVISHHRTPDGLGAVSWAAGSSAGRQCARASASGDLVQVGLMGSDMVCLEW